MSTEDAQRDLEQRALRNVRGLVDKMETTEADERRLQRRTILIVAAVVAVVAGLVLYAVLRNPRTDPVVIDPAKLPPIKVGPQR